MDDDERGGWSESASSRSSAIVIADTGSLLLDRGSNKVDTLALVPASGGGFNEMRRNGAAGKLARLLLTGPDVDATLPLACSRSGRAAKHCATLTPLSFKIRLVSSSS